jgi:hypothetical protein
LDFSTIVLVKKLVDTNSTNLAGMRDFDPRKHRATPSGHTSDRNARYYGPRPMAMKIPPGTSDYFEAEPNIRNPHKDYNLVALSDFKINPSVYMHWSKAIPLAITRYGRIQSMVLSLGYYNQLLLKIREVQAETSRLKKLLKTVDPNLLKVAAAMRIQYELNPDKAVWPLLDQQPKRRATDDLSRQSLFEAVNLLRNNPDELAGSDGNDDALEQIDGW